MAHCKKLLTYLCILAVMVTAFALPISATSVPVATVSVEAKYPVEDKTVDMSIVLTDHDGRKVDYAQITIVCNTTGVDFKSNSLKTPVEGMDAYSKVIGQTMRLTLEPTESDFSGCDAGTLAQFQVKTNGKATSVELSIDAMICFKDGSVLEWSCNQTVEVKYECKNGHVYDDCMDGECNVCGQTRVPQGEHRYSSDCDVTCDNEGCEYTRQDAAAHTGGQADCQHRAICASCGEAYGSFGSHNFENGVCTVCGEAEQSDSLVPAILWILIAVAVVTVSGCVVVVLKNNKRRAKK